MLKKMIPALSLLLCASPLYAAHPLVSDDTGTQGQGNWQLELNSEFFSDREREGGITQKESGGEVSAALSFGLSDRIDLVVGCPLAWYEAKEEGVVAADESGIGDLSVELKWRFFDDDRSGFSLALKPGLSLPTGDEHKGLGSGEISGGVLLIATKESGPLTLHANVGYTRNGYALQEDEEGLRRDIWSASFAGEYELSEKLRAVADIGMATNEEKGSAEHPAFLLGGLIYSVSENLDLDCGFKAGLNDAETDSTFLVGMATRF